MTERLRAAVITTRNRHEQYAACVAAIAPQVDLIVTVHHQPPSEVTGSEVEVFAGMVWLYPEDLPHDLISVVRYREEQANISRMWNMGLQAVHLMAWKLGQHYDVAVLNDDAVVSDEWFAVVRDEIHYRGAAAGSVAPVDGMSLPEWYWKPVAVDLRRRMTGFAFMLNGDKLVRADEEMRWWLSDDSIDWTARARGGTVVVPRERAPVQHPEGGGTPVVGHLAEWFEEDKVKFAAKWGSLPV